MKLTTHRSLHVFPMLLLCGSLAFGQNASEPGNKKPRSLDDYQRRTLKEIITMKADPKDLRDKQERLVVTAGVLPSMVQATYTGTTRLMSQLKKQSIRQWARLYAGSMEHYTEPYQTEMLFLEDGKPYWLVVQTNSALAKRELRRGQALNLYLIRVGALIVGDKFDWTLLVEDFHEAETSQPSAEITFQEMRDGKPPLLYLVFDVVLRNDRTSPRWFLLPSNLGPGEGMIGEKGGVNTLEVFTPQGNGQVIIGRFLGTGGFHALLLPPRAEVRLRRFPISFWGDLPASLQIEIVIANRLTIGGESAQSWFGVEALSSARADISEDAESVKRLVRSKRSRDYKEMRPRIEEDRRLHLSVSLKSK